MTELIKTLMNNQFQAALCTLNACIERCPEDRWNQPIANLSFNQAAFHTLFFGDVYLGLNPEEFKTQPYHLEHLDVFRDYEEMEDRRQVLSYSPAQIRDYMLFVREKGTRVILSETAETLAGHNGFWHKFTRAELHVYNTRHIQHHAAQLSLRLRIDRGIDIPWVGSNWKELPPAK